ncbi:3,4-dihydroxy-2-butanone-4-phosphate synthase [Actinomycetospora sp. OC33-EN08]|uniref:3,4-dihydroxy-2-butanone-4-phosphate synthase n=1 Tax=Actinomycetospora aurantiaca TaxID=3129233 RepID=A0ABU8MNF3_9PSEU
MATMARIAAGQFFLAAPVTTEPPNPVPTTPGAVPSTSAQRADVIAQLAAHRIFDVRMARRAGIPVHAATPQGVLAAAPGVAEFAVDLVRGAGLGEVALVTEVVRTDESGADSAGDLAARHGLEIVSSDLIVAERLRTWPLAIRGPEIALPTEQGVLLATGYRDSHSGAEHLVLRGPNTNPAGVPAVHVHQHCPAGDVFGALTCSCRAQLDTALAEMATSGTGITVYLRDTAARLRHPEPRLDERRAHLVASMLQDLHVRRVQLRGDDEQQRAALRDRDIAC